MTQSIAWKRVKEYSDIIYEKADGIAKVTMIRQVSTTHAFDMGQRLNTLGFTVGPDGTSLVVTPPGSGRAAPPGPYLLFILDGSGVPSVAQTILVGP